MQQHRVRVHRSSEGPPKERQLAHRIATVAADPATVEADVVEMIGNRVIDNAAVAAALRRRPVRGARAQATRHPLNPGATIMGTPAGTRVSPEWAAWANGVAVRELDFHDTFLAADYSHPGDNIPPILAVAQHTSRTGLDLRPDPPAERVHRPGAPTGPASGPAAGGLTVGTRSSAPGASVPGHRGRARHAAAVGPRG